MLSAGLKHKRGFTLLELLISVGLLVLVWTALVGSIVVGKAIEIRARHRIQATYAAQRVIESLRKIPYDDIHTIGNNNAQTIMIDEQTGLSGAWTVVVRANNFCKRINVTIRWTERAPMRGSLTVSESLSTYIPRTG